MGISGKTLLWSAITGALLAALPPHLAARAGGTIVGTISTMETARPPLKVSVGSDTSVCGTSIVDEAITVDGAGRVANAVVTVAGVKSPAPAEITVSNEKCRFVPHVAVVRPAGTVKVTNRDPAPVMHTTHAQMTDGKFLFNVSLPIPNQTVTKKVDKSGTLQLVCNTHPWMRGWLFVTEDLSAASGVDGTFRLEGVPAGTRELRIWHEALKAAPVQVTVKDGETSTVAVTLVK